MQDDGVALTSIDSSTSFDKFDVVVIVADHSVLPRERLLAEAKLVVDTRDALHVLIGRQGKFYGL